IQKTCSCPAWADLCKHLAAMLYGIGARLDTRPELLFTLRQVDQTDLITRATTMTGFAEGGTTEPTLASDALADVFGIELESGSETSLVTTASEALTTEAAPAGKPAVKKAAKKVAKKKVVKKSAKAVGKPKAKARATQEMVMAKTSTL